MKALGGAMGGRPVPIMVTLVVCAFGTTEAAEGGGTEKLKLLLLLLLLVVLDWGIGAVKAPKSSSSLDFSAF